MSLMSPENSSYGSPAPAAVPRCVVRMYSENVVPASGGFAKVTFSPGRSSCAMPGSRPTIGEPSVP